MFALASDLLRYVRVDVQGPHLLIPDRSVQSRSAPLRLAGPAVALGSGLDLHRWRAAVGPLASTAGIDVTAGHLPVGGGTGERLDPDDIGVRGSAGEPHAGGARARPSAAGYESGSLSVTSSAGRCEAELTGACPLRNKFFGDGTRTRPGWASNRKCPRGRHLPRRATGTQQRFVVEGVTAWTLIGPPWRRLL
jgi:hypothetical protein